MPRKTSNTGALSRRRGAASRGHSINQPLYTGIKILFGLAATLTLFMLVLFTYSMPNSGLDSTTITGTTRLSRAQQKLAGLPNLLRGHVQPKNPEGAPAGQQQKLKDSGSDNSANVADKNSLEEKDGAEDDDDKIKRKERLRHELEQQERKEMLQKHQQQHIQLQHQHPQQHDLEQKERHEALLKHQQQMQLQHQQQHEKQKKKSLRGDAAAAVAVSQTHPIDLNLYNGTPTKPYPYPLQVVPESLDIGASWTPLGGGRFAEYTTGGTPYLVENDAAMKRQSDAVARSRRFHVLQSAKHAWQGYRDHAFGQDEVLPQSKRGNNNWGGQGITLVDSLDTLWLLGMKDEFYAARDWVRDSLSHEHVHSVSVFETTIRDLGGLLSAYDWSGDAVFLEKAKDLGERLLKAFDGSATGLPFGQVDLSSGMSSNIGWTGGNIIIAECGTLQLENRYLSKQTGDVKFAKKTEHVFEILKGISPANGLFPYYIRNSGRRHDENHGNGKDDNNKEKEESKPEFANDKLTFGAMADSLYEYMLKVWIQGGKTETMYREMYDLAVDSMHKELLQTSTPSGLVYIADKSIDSGSIDHKMDHLVCFMGGLLALGAYTDPLGLDSDHAQRDLRTGKALTYTCYQMYARMNTGISPEYVQFHVGKDLQVGRGAPHYLLRPEAVESMFILNQLTGDPIYREWGWEVYQSIEKYCKTSIAYGALSDVQETSGKPRDSMESFFLAETLKYLYLLQDPDTEVDVLHKHVFNTEAHPMRIFPILDQQKQTS